jgi:hypothetical protein
MFSTLEIWNALVEAAKALQLVPDVRAYPLHKIDDEKFYKDIPDLGEKAALVVHRGWDHMGGKRRRRWSLIIVIRDAAGKAFEESSAAADGFDARLLDTEIMQNQVWVTPASSAAVANSGADCSVVELTFESLEAISREVTE